MSHPVKNEVRQLFWCVFGTFDDEMLGQLALDWGESARPEREWPRAW